MFNQTPFLNTKKAGFTLIELLVVIAIIALLSSIVLSALSSARQKGIDSANDQQVHQVKTALELYFSDHDYYPGKPGVTIRSDDANTTNWQEIVTTLTPKYISSIPTKSGAALVYQGVACGSNPNQTCSYSLTTDKVVVNNSGGNTGGTGGGGTGGGGTGGSGGGTGGTGAGSGAGLITAKTYYVDDVSGADTNNGLSADTAWKTITKVNGTNLAPGDGVLLKRGGVWHQKLIINNSGTSPNPIVVSSYGDTSLAKPLIDLQNAVDFGIYIASRSYIIIQDVAVANAKSDAGPSAGVAILNAKNITIDSVDVSGVKGIGGMAIYATGAGLLDNVIVRNSQVSSTQKSGFPGANGTGIQLWADCDCGTNVKLLNNTITTSAGHGIGLFIPNTIVQGNTSFRNNMSGIGSSNDEVNNIAHAHNELIDGNTIYENCQFQDDCFGINMFRTGGNNVIRNNIVHDQRDTKNDPAVPANAGYGGVKFGTGGIRFDGGDAYSLSLYGPEADYSSQTGNVISNNQISNEYQGIQIYNFSGVSVANNTINYSKSVGLKMFEDNTSNSQVVVTMSGNTISNTLSGGTDTSTVGNVLVQ